VQREQMPLPFQWPVADRDEDFLVGDANRLVYTHLTRWSLWPVMATLLTGPRKSGRSMLGRIFVRKTGGRLFDDVENHDEEAIFHAWNDAQARRRPILLIGDRPSPAWQIGLPDLASRIAATPHVEIAEPDDALIAQLLVKLLSDRGIAAPPDLADFLVPRIERSYVAVQNVVDTLDREILANRKRMSLAAARQALTGAGLIRRAVRRAQEEPN
jgi:chromosomal replication initiation ATPase DnaA